MNLLDNKKIRFFIILALGFLQVAGVTIPEPYAEYLFLGVNLAYFLLGFLSTNWRQATRNLVYSTVPVAIMMMALLLVIALRNHKISEVAQTVELSLMIWGVILLVAVPLFALGFGLRQAVLWTAKQVAKQKV